jgi:hypothetical protein
VIVEYALRDSAKPMGVAEYRLSDALPEPLRGELPTVAEFAREFPLMSLVKLRIEIERELRSILGAQGGATTGIGIGTIVEELAYLGMVPASAGRFRTALDILNRAAHGYDISREAALDAAEAAEIVLAELRRIARGERA